MTTPRRPRRSRPTLIKELAGGPLPKNLATQLFDVYDDKSDEAERSKASTGWLRALGLIEEED